MFTALYEKVMRWSRHRHAMWILGGLSFAESSFFPVPPDVLLAPMSLAQPEKALHFALLTTLASVAGGIFGYLIGYYFLDMIILWLENSHYWEGYLTAKEWFSEWGFWAVFLAGFSPIPYKVFTITAGALAMAFVPFVIASLVGRGARFFLVAFLLSMGGERLEKRLYLYINRIGWSAVFLVVAGVLIYSI